MIIIIIVPIIIAGMYTSKQLSIYTFVLTVLSIIISTYAGYYYGVCDANMVLLTTTSMNHLVENGTFLLNQVSENPGVTLALYYVLPRCLMAMSFGYVSNIVKIAVEPAPRRHARIQVPKCARRRIARIFQRLSRRFVVFF